MTMQADLIALNDEIATKQTRMADLLKDINELPSAKAGERAAEIRTANAELTELGQKRDKLDADVAEIERAREAVKASQRNVSRQVDPDPEDRSAGPATKSVADLIGDAIDGSPYLKSQRAGLKGYRGTLGEVPLKTLITSADMTPQAQRLVGIQPYLTEERNTVGELVLQGTTTAQKIEYFEETTFTNAADFVAEGDAKPEGALDWTLREANVRKIAVWIPVTDEFLSDIEGAESLIRGRIGFMVRQKEEHALLNGSGTAPAIQGILQNPNIQTVTGYGQTTLDSIYQAITEVRVDGWAEPTALVIHPRDWFDIRTSKDDNGNYLLGPATAEGPMSVWGLTVRATTNIAENTGLVGAFRPHAQIFRKGGVEIAISTEHDVFFVSNKLAIRAEERLALAVYRPKAFCKVEALVQGS